MFSSMKLYEIQEVYLEVYLFIYLKLHRVPHSKYIYFLNYTMDTDALFFYFWLK